MNEIQNIEKDDDENSLNEVDETPENVEELGEDASIQEAAKLNPFEAAAFGFKKRIGKLTAKNKIKDEQIEKLQEEIEKLKRSKNSNNDLDSIFEESDLESYLKDARNEKRNLLRTLAEDGQELDFQGKLYSRKELSSYLEKLDDIIDIQIPKKREHLKDQQNSIKKTKEVKDLALKTFPELEDESSPMAEWVNAQLQDKNLKENLQILLPYAFKGLNVSRLREQVVQKAQTLKQTKKPTEESTRENETINLTKERLSLNDALKFFK